ncbi:MAG: hypothetical protein PHP26_10690, partial [Syntrophomonas sp.]|nr:hypothetical protein [Syntrophomonas sp.]
MVVVPTLRVLLRLPAVAIKDAAMGGIVSDSDTRSAYNYLKYLLERKRKNKTWAEIKQLLPDDEPLGKEELRQLEAPDDYIILEQEIEEYDNMEGEGGMTTSIKQIEEIIQRLPVEKLEILLEIARDIENEELSPEDIADIEAGKTEIERGEWV